MQLFYGHPVSVVRASDSTILFDIVRVINHSYVCMYVSRFHLIPERYGQTDRRTDGQTELLYQYRASVC